ncbi:hypothetical protein GGF32_002734 [Allomyces javanicus]|nr:hypothetical protein GGF32_002734 [Allomyces javanicus]
MATSNGTDAAFSVTLCRKRCYPQWTRRKTIDGVPIKRRPRKKPAVERDPDGDAEDDGDGDAARARSSAAPARAAVDHDDDDMDVDVEATTPKRIAPPAAAAPLFAPPAVPQDPLFALVTGQMYVARTMMQIETMRARLALRERLHAMGSAQEVVKYIDRGDVA